MMNATTRNQHNDTNKKGVMMSTSFDTLQEKAEHVSRFFTRKTVERTGEAPKSIVTLTDDAPEVVRDLAHDAHDRMMPDDYRYIFIETALESLAEHDDDDEAFGALEASIYTHQLTAWLNSHGSRVEYLTEVLREYGAHLSGTDMLQEAQLMEMREVFQSVRESLEDMELADLEGGDDD